MRSFSLKRDWRLIMWGPTLQVNAVRAVVAGLFWTIVMLIIALVNPQSSPFRGAGGEAVLFPFALMLFMLALMLLTVICSWLAKLGVPLVGWMPIMTLFYLLPGDPFLYAVHKLVPALVPAEIGFFNFRALIFVINETN